nr:mitochondrial GTPase 1-like isoform X2 [Lepeophtheirus salmonis]
MQDPSLSEVLFTSCLNSSIKKVLPKCLEVIENFPRYERGGGAERNIIVIGIPNVGKSSLINHIRNNRFKISGDATRVGALPGVTRALQTKIRVNQDPLTYVWDSPGILFPSMKNESVALKLAVCKCLRDDLIGEKIVADYLLFHLNKYQHFKYVKTLGLEAPTDNIDTLLTQIAVNHNWINKVKNLVNNSMEEMPNKKQASTYFLMLFRKGKFGSINLDSDELDTKNKTSGKILITI